MRALILVTDTRRGGAPGRCAAVALGLRAFGWESVVVSVQPAGSLLADLAGRDTPVHSLDLTTARGLPAAVRKLRALVRDWQPDIVQASLWHANVLARVGLWGLRIPIVCTFEGIDVRKPRLRVLLDRLSRGRAAANVAVCQAVARVAITRDGVDARRLQTIATGLDVAYWAPCGRRSRTRAEWHLSDGDPVVGWSGRMEREKDLAALVAALPHLPGWRLALAGDGRLRPALDEQARQLGVAHRVIGVGELLDVRPFLEGLDVFALASREEGLPIALLEAMAMELPVVATRVGGIPELIAHADNGLLVEPGDPAALAAAILTARGDTSLGRRGRQTIATRFSEMAMLRAYDSLWRSVCAASPRGSRSPAASP